MAEAVYTELREFLDGLPGGFPETPEGWELEMLEMLYTPEEARMTTRLRHFPEPARVIARRCGMSKSGAAGMLDSMARKGLIYRMRAGGEDFFQAIQFVVGVHEFHVDSIDREYVELAEELGEYMAGTVVQQFRVVPVKAADDSIAAVIDEYRKQFGNPQVMHTTIPIDVEFFQSGPAS